MTKLGTPIGAGPKGAIVVVGLAAVGVPPASYWEPPSGPLGRGWSPPPLAPGAVTAPSPVPAPPRPSLLVTPPCLAGDGVGAGTGLGTGADSLGAEGDEVGGVGASLVSSGFSQSGSCSSRRPSPSSSMPLAQAGACSEGMAVVVVPAGSTAEPSESGSAPARAVPSAVTARKPAQASSSSANLVLIPKRPCPRSVNPSLGSAWKLPTSTCVRNANGRPQHGLNQRLKHRCNGRFSAEPDVLVKLL